MQQNAAGGMPQHAQMRALERAHQAVRHFVRVPDSCSCGRCRSRNPARPARRFPGPSRRRAGCRIQGPRKCESHADRIHFPNLMGERDGALFIQAVGHGQRLGMIGDGDIFVAARAAGFGHFFQRRAAVGLGGVHVQVAANVRLAPPVSEASLGRRFHLAPVFAQFRRNPGKAERGVNFFFGRAGHALIGVDASKARIRSA